MHRRNAASSMAAESNPRTSRNSSPTPMSTARSSAARASIRNRSSPSSRAHHSRRRPMRILRILRRVVLGALAAILSVYLVFAIGLTALEWIVRDNPKVADSLLAHSTAPHTLMHFDQGAASFHRRLELIQSARKSIELEFFIYNVDEAARLLTQALMRKARE